MKSHLLVLILSAAVVALADINGNYQTIIGVWQLTELGGRSIGDRILHIEYRFQTNGSFSVTAQMKGSAPIQYSGTFSIVTDKLRLSIPGTGTNDLPYTLTNGILKIQDPKIDSWVKLTKEAERGGAGSGSEPIRAETNGTSSASGSRR